MSVQVLVEGLCISVRTASGEEADIVHEVGFSAAPGEVVALIGESGSGKTTTALALLGYTRRGCRVRKGRLEVGGVDALRLAPEAVADYRGRRVSYIAQSAAASFNPAHRLLDQVVEGCVVRGQLVRAAAEAKALDLFAELALPDPAALGKRYPHEVSGGQLQRVMTAMALMTDPDLVVLDEPTTALDVTTQVEVLRAFRRVVRGRGATAVYVSHDLAVVAQMADSIVVLQNGRVQETGRTAQLLAAPAHDYTRSLLDAVPTGRRQARTQPQLQAQPPPAPKPVLEAEGLAARYGGPGGVPVLRDVGLRLAPGAVLGVIGESGSGKSTLARVLVGLLPASAGTVRLNGAVLPPAAADRTKEQLRQVQIVFQSADTSLNPAHTVARIIERPLAFYHGMAAQRRRARVAALMDLVRLPAALAGRRVTGLSGGQKQRVNLARALAADPAVLICDEVTSALDTVVGAAVLELLAELRRSLGVAMVFISHDLATVREIADDVMVMYAGRPVENGQGSRDARPVHPYTDLLGASVPELRVGWLDGLRPRPPSDAAPTAARLASLDTCAFFTRCDLRLPGTCDVVPTPELLLSRGAAIRCCRTEEELYTLQVPPARPLQPAMKDTP